MKFRFLYLGDKTLSHREEGLLRVFNCENHSFGNSIFEHKKIYNSNLEKVDNDEENFKRVCLNKKGVVIDFFSLETKNFINRCLNENFSFKDLFKFKKKKEINIIFFDSLNRGSDIPKESMKLFLNRLNELFKEVSSEKVLIIFNEEGVFNRIIEFNSEIEEISLLLNNYDVDLKEFVHSFVDFISLKNDLYDKWFLYRKELAKCKLTLGKGKGENFSGDIILKILSGFSKIQGDNLFKLILMSNNYINLNEISLIEDALKDYIPLSSKLIIKQLTNEFLNNEVRFLLFSK
ncbi:TPA: hypothetical protein ACOTG0_002167 [Clostridium perfringens]